MAEDEKNKSTEPDAYVENFGKSLSDAMPKKIGPYRLLEQIGEGGMGIVYLAEQTEPVRRRVALKLIKLGMDTKQVIARFEAERQALAMMDHPNVAKVFDAGVTHPEAGSRSYFVMEHVPGVPITEHCDRQRLSIDQRLNLFMQICQAVQHAHQKGVIHRDIKPGNILIGASGGPKVIDFGVAKAIHQKLTERTLFTEQGQLIGTPGYMSPEQAEMTAQDIDTRSDIYSLGVLLYELLTGVLPFDPTTLRHATFGEIQRIIREEEPPKPSTRLSSLGDASATHAQKRQADMRSLIRDLRGDLDWITMKALEKDRDRRYETANGFAVDILRHLSHEPVAAGPPRTMYRMSKFIRRNRTSVLAGVVVTVALIAATGVSIGFALSEAEQRRLAEEKTQEASDNLTLAERREEEAIKQAEIAQAVNNFLNDDLLAAVAPSPKSGKGKDVLMRDVLDETAKKIENAAAPGGRFADRPLIEARIRATLGWTYHKLGEYPSAEPHMERVRELRRRELGEEHPDTLSIMNNLAILYYDQGRYDAAVPLFVKTLEIRKRVLGEEHPDTLKSINNLANLYTSQGQYGEAEPLYITTHETLKRTLGDEHPDTLTSIGNLANLYMIQGRYGKVEPLYLETHETLKRILGDDHPDTLGSINNMGGLLNALGRHIESESILRESVERGKNVLGADHWRVAEARSLLGESLAGQKRLEEAEPLLLEGYTDLESSLPGDRRAQKLPHAIERLIKLYDAWGMPDEADEWRAKLAEFEAASRE